MILTRRQMIESEEAAFSRGISAEALMESAGRQIAGLVMQFHPRPGTCRVFAGKGNNGGDVFVAARYLSAAGWGVELDVPDPGLGELAGVQRERAVACDGAARPFVVLDGLLGIGASGVPREPVAGAIRRILELRERRGAWVLSADVPSGLDADSGVPADPCVVADATMAMGFAKLGLVADHAVNFVGRLAVARLEGLEPPPGVNGVCDLIEPGLIRRLVPRRAFDTHKGMAGRVAIVAGSRDFPGAARMASAAAVSAGAGLVTLVVDRGAHDLLASCVIPEVMMRCVDSYGEILGERWDAMGIGPGLTTRQASGILEVVHGVPCPCVVDADALNVVAAAGGVLGDCAGERLLTPHPGEMERLFPQNRRTRLEWLTDYIETSPHTLLLKGARTLVGRAGQPAAYNTTGNPGMASGGMGDVLTGTASALLSQGLATRDAAMVAAWVCGRSAEIAMACGGESQESLRATSVIAHLGSAFDGLRGGDW